MKFIEESTAAIQVGEAVVKEKIDWKRKLSSRKFWMALINLVTNLLIAFRVSESEIVQVTSIILATGGLVAYIIAEGFVDAANTDITIIDKTKVD